MMASQATGTPGESLPGREGTALRCRQAIADCGVHVEACNKKLHSMGDFMSHFTTYARLWAQGKKHGGPF